MLDFVNIVTTRNKTGSITIWPEFLVQESEDLMIKGKNFYAVWNEETGLWDKSEHTVRKIIDKALTLKYQEVKEKYKEDDIHISVSYLKNSSSKRWKEWQSYVKSLPDNFHQLDESVTFSNTEVKKEDYISRRLPFPIESGKCECYNEIISTLYEPSEREKLEWAIGSIIQGDSKRIQKFIVLYGDKGSGKSTILNIYQDVLNGYYSTFNAKDLGSSNVNFALESFKDNPLIAIQHDGNLSKIEDNTRLNSIVSHEPIEIDVKYAPKFPLKLNAFLFMGTNSPVKITDSKSGLLRRLIDVYPSGNKLSTEKYYDLTSKVKFELGAIAYHCLNVYNELGRFYYDDYVPIEMMGATNDFFNFVEDSYFYFKEAGESEDGLDLDSAYVRYTVYAQEANVPYPYSRRVFKEELKSYFKEFTEAPGKKGSIYRHLREDRFKKKELKKRPKKAKELLGDGWLVFDGKECIFDKELEDIPAQYCRVDEDGNEIPEKKWEKVTTKLKDIDTSIIHYCRPDSKYIVIDLDLKDENGNKSLEKNIEAANKYFTPTYAEVSKGGQGIHLVYIYKGNVEELEDLYLPNIEIKKFLKTKLSSLRRRLSKFNSLAIATITSGLPLKKEVKKVVDIAQFEGEKKLKCTILKAVRKKVHGDTSSNIDFIKKILDDAYNSGEPYDVRDLKGVVQSFAAGSTNQSQRCSRVVSDMHFCSKNIEEAMKNENGEEDSYYEDEPASVDRTNWENAPIAIFDVEIFMNLSLICYKIYDAPGHEGEHKVHAIINPKPKEVIDLVKSYRLVGFNNRKYDNGILYAMMQGYSNIELYHLSQRIISGQEKNFSSAITKLSYTDIFDFSSDKKSLKKFEIELGIHHQEVGIPWDQPVPDELIVKVVEYCMNDVIATEAVWNSKDRQKDWIARQILAEISGLTVNDTNNQHSQAIIFGNDRNPQREFVYTDLSIEFPGYEFNQYGIDKEKYEKNSKGKPIYTSGKSVYLGEDPSEGGYAWGKPGMYGNVKAFDVSSMHPSTMIWLNIFGDRYTAKLKELVDLRKHLKWGDVEFGRNLFNGKLIPYLEDEGSVKGVDKALKIVINSIYGLTAAHFDNRFRDKRNVDNIVAKRGALFMIMLKHKVQEMGYEVVHCKTDCIKVADADEKITNYIFEMGTKYGYNFEVEHWFDKFFLVNKAAYVGRLRDEEGNLGKWIAVADEFKEPYVFKSLFSHEEITFDDLCQTKSVKSAIYLDMNEELGEMPVQLAKEMEKIEKKLKKGIATEEETVRYDELSKEELKYHNYVFVGKVGSYCPIKPGFGGGRLVREQDGKMYAVESTTGYRWMEAETVRGTNLEDFIDMRYYEDLADKAVEDIRAWGDFEWFVSDEKYGGAMRIPIGADKALKNQVRDIIKDGSGVDAIITENGVEYVDESLNGYMNKPEAA